MPIYFVQPREGGPIRIGASQNVAGRLASMSAFHPAGFELIAEMEGYLAREAVVHLLLHRHRLRRDWFASNAVVWRFLLEVIDGSTFWLPDSNACDAIFREDRDSLISEAIERCGGASALCAMLGIKSLAPLRISSIASAPLAGAIGYLRMSASGSVPNYLLNPKGA